MVLVVYSYHKWVSKTLQKLEWGGGRHRCPSALSLCCQPTLRHLLLFPPGFLTSISHSRASPPPTAMKSKPSLYNHKPHRLTKDPITSSSSSNLAFASSLSSLLATSASTPASGRPRASKPTKSKDDSIFTAHNKGTQKRALADTAADGPLPQKHARTAEHVDAATLSRSRRKMEEKARLYASMKRGDYVPPPDGGRDKEGEGLIDFDRKWAESEEAGGGGRAEDGDSSSDDYGRDSGEEEGDGMVEYEDEFGRLRTGTKGAASLELRRRNAQVYANAELAEAKARPQRPDNIIYGDAVQHAAFNPDATLTAQMESLAKKRDRSITPPEEVHYDASKEVRTKGVGFFQFSRDKEGRAAEMERLKRDREETERGRRAREERKEERKRKLEERKKKVGDKRGEKLAEAFLNGLDVP